MSLHVFRCESSYECILQQYKGTKKTYKKTITVIQSCQRKLNCVREMERWRTTCTARRNTTASFFRLFLSPNKSGGGIHCATAVIQRKNRTDRIGKEGKEGRVLWCLIVEEKTKHSKENMEIIRERAI
jgi:hypothetical protein